MLYHKFLISPLFVLGVPLAAAAADAPAVPSADADIIVTAPYARSTADALQGVTVLSGDALQRNLQATIGETIARTPGASSTSFGPGASRPVLRGLQGERIRVLTDGLGSLDVSNTSPDHAVSMEPITASRVEILRGPATLLFGSSALGGVVNLIDDRIRDRAPGERLEATGRFQLQYGTAANERAVGGTLNALIAPNLVAHLDSAYRQTDDLKIADFAESRVLRAAEGELGQEDPDERGKLDNSDLRTTNAGVGFTFVGRQGFLGVVASVFDTNYGVPGKEEEQAQAGVQRSMGAGDKVRIDLRQTRLDLKGGLRFESGFIAQIKLRGAYADYKHVELEGAEEGTRFLTKGWEGRLEAVQRVQGNWRGAFGVQVNQRDFQAVGEEAFIPRNNSYQVGLFTLQEVELGAWTLEGSARYEHSRAKLKEDAQADLPTGPVALPEGFAKRFNAFSVAGGAAYAFGDTWRLGGHMSYVERAPSAEELFANGPHAATRAFEIGNPNFGKESAVGGELTLKATYDRLTLAVSGYVNDYRNFIIDRPTGAVEDGLAVYRFDQVTARLYGLEAQAAATVYDSDALKLVVDGLVDVVRGENRTANRPLPRIPAFRALLGAEAQTGPFDLRAEVELVAKQDRIDTFELPTDGYEMLNLSAGWRPLGRERAFTILVQANNLLNQDARRHASYLKDQAPLAGRDVRVSINAGF
jgi:iron complex outermembrane recepter protein